MMQKTILSGWALALAMLAPAVVAEEGAGTEPAPSAPVSAVAEPAAAQPAPPAASAPAAAPTAPSSTRARDALKAQEGDASAEKNLEEVFQAAEKQYSLLKSGDMSLDYSLSYSYFRNDRVDLAFTDSGSISRFLIEQDAQHSFSNNFSFDYGVWNNLTLGLSLPLLVKYDSSKDVAGAALGDVAISARWQPFALKRGAPTTTLFVTASTATGDSPYKINPATDLSSGKGYYAGSFGASTSKVIDPAVVFGSLSYTMAFDITDLNQHRGDRTLIELHPGDSIGFSMGMAYSLSYDLSVSVSYQQSYAFQTEYLMRNIRTQQIDFVGSEDSTSASLGTSVGIRMSPTRIVNVSFGFGLTEEASDVTLGVSLPIDVAGLKQ